jgi:hypothetical protein
MRKQKWIVTIDEKEIVVEYKYSYITGKTILVVDGDSFTVKGKTFGVGIARRESIIVGGEQAILDVKHSGRAELIVREGDVKEA